MGSFSIWHWLIVLVVVALLFGGRGKLSGLMGDAAKGIRAFKDGLKGEDGGDDVSAKPLPKEREKEDARG
ncbi:twin-arginine translocase TatA/TatE family subunit [Phenylobacterium sp.]|uniref:twin-arginine translocase TatA/TatE family subunit n=1 Tax=Phenylobacterium sp. TaxID=1871053 RepID=UPI003782D95F